MTALITTCRGCGRAFQPDRQSILRGEWKTCPGCRPTAAPPPDDAGGRCVRCGTPLPAHRRGMCSACARGAPAL